MTERRIHYGLIAGALVWGFAGFALAQTPAPVSRPGFNAGTTQPTLPSVMFSQDEQNQIQKAMIQANSPEPSSKNAAAAAAKAPRLPNIYVSAVLDLGGGEWTVWANGLRITPQAQTPLFKVMAVNGNRVDIFIPGDDGGRFSIRPYETWRSRQRDVIQGIVP